MWKPQWVLFSLYFKSPILRPSVVRPPCRFSLPCVHFLYKTYPINLAVSKWQPVAKGFISMIRWHCEHLPLNWLEANCPTQLQVQVGSYGLSIKRATMGLGIVKNKRPWVCKQKTFASATSTSNGLCPPERHLAAHDCSCVKIGRVLL